MRAMFFVLVAVAFGVAGAAVACSSEPAVNPYKLPDGPVPTSTAEPDAGAPRDAGGDAIVDANAPDTATPLGWCSYHPKATAPDPVARVWVDTMGDSCRTNFCDGGASTLVVTNDIKPGESAPTIRPSRTEGCRFIESTGTKSEMCCPPGCLPAMPISACLPGETRYKCPVNEDGGFAQLRPATNCRMAGGGLALGEENWCCDDTKPY
jgi:hypothetical protein